jgi:TPR repeat protein
MKITPDLMGSCTTLAVAFLLLVPLGSYAQEWTANAMRGSSHPSAYQRAVTLADQREDSAALALLRPLADAGHADAALLLGRMHTNGWGVPTSRDDGLAVLRRAALTAAPDAHAVIGFHFLFDDSFPGYDPAQARRWFVAAEAGGSARGAFGLGLLYRHGRGVPHDDSTAATWFRQAADAGFAPAAVLLASMHDDPGSPLHDPAEADRAFAAAAHSGGAGLIAAWAEAYAGGPREWFPVPIDTEAAARLRRRAERLARAGASRTGGDAPSSGLW